MKETVFLMIICLNIMPLIAQDDVTIGKYRKFESEVLAGEVTYLVHL